MQWLIERMNNHLHHDDNDVTILKVLEETNRPYIEIKQIPFTNTLLEMEQLDTTKPALVYGSTQIIEKISKQYPSVSTFWGEDWFDPQNWVGKRSDLLNEDVTSITVADLRKYWIKEPTFVKSVTVKALTGMVLEPDKKDWDNWLIEQSHLDGAAILVLSPVKRIDREWRFFVIEGKVVTGSTYRKDGYRSKFHPVSPEAWAAINKAVQEWMPSSNIVIDIARTRENKYKIVEFNCLSCSGFYNSDVTKLVSSLESIAGW